MDFDALHKTLAGLIDKSHQGPRPDPRVQLRVMLTLQGIDAAKGEFKIVTATEDVASKGFLCGCTVSLDTGAIVRVHLAKEGQAFAGNARVARGEWPNTLEQRCDFEFLEKPLNWALQ